MKKISYDQLIAAKYKQVGNWYIKGTISVNLFSNTIKHNVKPYFEFPLLSSVRIGDIEILRMALKRIEA